MSTSTSSSTMLAPPTSRLLTLADLEEGDYVVDLRDPARHVRRISQMTDRGVLLEQMGAIAYSPAQCDWATEAEIDAAIAGGTVS